jgi:hypothetical protein
VSGNQRSIQVAVSSERGGRGERVVRRVFSIAVGEGEVFRCLGHIERKFANRFRLLWVACGLAARGRENFHSLTTVMIPRDEGLKPTVRRLCVGSRESRFPGFTAWRCRKVFRAKTITEPELDASCSMLVRVYNVCKLEKRKFSRPSGHVVL